MEWSIYKTIIMVNLKYSTMVIKTIYSDGNKPRPPSYRTHVHGGREDDKKCQSITQNADYYYQWNEYQLMDQ